MGAVGGGVREERWGGVVVGSGFAAAAARGTRGGKRQEARAIGRGRKLYVQGLGRMLRYVGAFQFSALSFVGAFGRVSPSRNELCTSSAG